MWDGVIMNWRRELTGDKHLLHGFRPKGANHMADLSTLNGIGEARNDLYGKLERGEVTEVKAMAQERILRGQSELKASIPLRLVNIIAKAKNPKIQAYAEPLMRALVGFVSGPEAIEDLRTQDDKVAR